VSGLEAGSFGVTLLITGGALLVVMAVAFTVAIKTGKHSVVDTAWGIGLALAAVAALLSSIGHGQPPRRYTLLAASVLWGLRLAAYVWHNHGKGEDPRYRDLLSRARGNKNLYALRVIYLLQALILWLATVPVQAGMLERAPAGALVVIGALVWLGGFVFESVGDWQLARFKAAPPRPSRSRFRSSSRPSRPTDRPPSAAGARSARDECGGVHTHKSVHAATFMPSGPGLSAGCQARLALGCGS
jgi:steroid 5-alpha reductase family enzyme